MGNGANFAGSFRERRSNCNGCGAGAADSNNAAIYRQWWGILAQGRHTDRRCRGERSRSVWPAVRAYGPYPRNAAEEEHAQTRASPRQRESATATRAAVWATQGWAVLRLSCPQAQRSARDHIAIAARQTQGPPCEGCRRNRRQHLPANSGRRNARKRCAIRRCRDRSRNFFPTHTTPLFQNVGDFMLRAQNSAKACSRASGSPII